MTNWWLPLSWNYKRKRRTNYGFFKYNSNYGKSNETYLLQQFIHKMDHLDSRGRLNETLHRYRYQQNIGLVYNCNGGIVPKVMVESYQKMKNKLECIFHSHDRQNVLFLLFFDRHKNTWFVIASLQDEIDIIFSKRLNICIFDVPIIERL